MGNCLTFHRVHQSVTTEKKLRTDSNNAISEFRVLDPDPEYSIRIRSTRSGSDDLISTNPTILQQRISLVFFFAESSDLVSSRWIWLRRYGYRSDQGCWSGLPVYFFISRFFSHLGNQRKSTFVLVGTHYFTKNTSYMVPNCS